MSWGVAISGEYPKDWPDIADRVREEAGHRCVRCGHPYRTGQHGKGEWTPCDDGCNHPGPLAIRWPDGRLIEDICGNTARSLRYCSSFHDGKDVVAQWRILTVHHLDGNKANCEWWNLLPLCQRCHLTVQSRVDPQTPYFLEHSPWFQIYVAGFYAHKYEGKTISREEAARRMEELLAHERLA